MKIDEAFVEIEKILNQLDVLTVYDPLIGYELHNILRRIRTEKSDEYAKTVRSI